MADPSSSKRSGASASADSASGARLFLRFYLPPELRTETLALLDRVERAEDPTRYRAELARIVVALTERGLDAYYLEALRTAGAGFLVERSARLGVSSVLGILSPLLGGILGRLDASQLLAVCGHLRGLMR